MTHKEVDGTISLYKLIGTFVMNLKDVNEYLNYDPSTGLFTWIKQRKGSRGVGELAGSINTHHKTGKKYSFIHFMGEQCRAHRLAWFIMKGKECKTQIDHIDGNGTNNAWSNLRSTDNQGNSRNKRLYKVNKTGVSGVRWHKKARKWVAGIQSEGKNVHLGLFVDFDKAVKARRDAELKYGYHENHGESRPL